MSRTVVFICSFLLVGLFLGACSSSQSSSGETISSGSEAEKKELEFFQRNPESVDIFEELITEFEKENPEIDINQVSVPDPTTVLKTRFARGDIPDIFTTFPIENDYILKAENGYLLDLTNEEFIKNVQPSVQAGYEIDGEMYGVALAQNAVGVLYNKEIFTELNIEIPKTWEEFVSVLGEIEKAGEQPILMGNKTPMTTSVFNLNLVANEFDGDYWKKLNNGEVSIAGDPKWEELAEKMLTVVSYAQENSFGVEYEDVNKGFVNGEGAMYVMGTWALPSLEQMNPDFEYGYFPFPATNDPSNNKVLGGVEKGYSISAQTEYPEEAKKFLEFLVSKDTAQKFADLDGSISDVQGVETKKEEIKPLAELVNEGRTTAWPNWYWVGGTGAENDFRSYTQQFFSDKDVEAYLNNLDNMFENYRTQN